MIVDMDRRQETRRKYEDKRSRLSLPKEVFEKFREQMLSSGESRNDSFVETLLETYREHSSNCSNISLSPEIEGKKSFAMSTPQKDATVAEKTEFDSDASSLPSAIDSTSPARSPSYNQNASFTDDQDNFDLSIAYSVKGDYVYPKEDIIDRDSDSDYEDPEIKIRLEDGMDCTGLEEVGEEDDVLGVQEEMQQKSVEYTRSGLHAKMGADDAEKEELFIITKSRLTDLAGKAKTHCPDCAAKLDVAVRTASGSAAHVDWICPSGHAIPSWCTQETINGSHVGDVKCASALLLSGNNYRKVNLMARFMRLNFMGKDLFYSLQKKSICPAVESHWEKVQDAVIEKHHGKPVVLCGDGRNDSPGHSAQYLTYTLMEHETKDVVNVHFVDKREVDMKSPLMEAKGFRESLQQVEGKGLEVGEIVTDAHTSISKYMREERPGITHSWDTWHGAKNLGKKLCKVSARAATRRLVYWIRHVVLHFWYCAKVCAGSAKTFKAKWHGLTHHVCNKHEWVSGMGDSCKCDHGELENPEREEWLTPGEDSHKALVEVAYEAKFIKNTEYFKNFRHTSTLESLHNHILMYASKRYSFQYQAYRARNLLAVIDYMEHKDRPAQTDDQGKEKHVAVWSKHAKNYVARLVMVPKMYKYIPDLMRDILTRREMDGTPLFAQTPLMPGDPRTIRPRLAPYPAPSVDVILSRRQGRLSET